MPANRLKKSLTTTIVVPAILMALAALVLLFQLNRQMNETDWVEHTDLVMLLAETAKAEFLSAETAFRGLLLSSGPNDRGLIQKRWNNSQEIIKQLGGLVSDNPSQEQRLIELGGLENQWLEAANGSDQNSADAEKRELAGRAASIGTKVIAQFDAISAVEQGLRSARDAQRDSQYRLAMWGIPIVALILVVALTWVARREIQGASDTFAVALRDAEEANQAKSNFLAVVSHELRNPLNSILLWCNALLTTGTLEGKVDQGVNAIWRNAKAQAQLIEDLLDISRIESGQMRFDVQPTNPAEVVRAAVDSMSPAADAKSIAINVVLDPRADVIIGDAQRLQQAVWNLLSNAIKFTPKGGKVQVRLERINSHLEIVVADNGQGIDQPALEKIFDRFWQAGGPNSAERGMGLGLSIVKHIVSLHGGTVTAHSEGLNLGSVFIIRLPLPVTTAGLASPARRHPSVASIAQMSHIPRLESISVLVVDDDAETRDALRSLLTSVGAIVNTAENVDRAIAILAESYPDVLVSDLGMPGRDGYWLIKEIRSREKGQGPSDHLPAVALTAYGRVEDRVEVFASGFDSHVMKPVDPAELAAIIKRLVETRRSGNDKASPAQDS
ncbi:MAG: ATP-binding protein [Candidatus Binatus sp.]|uniref:ATP-binding protein n=1 Tax=Candidatus Binatus sp. TaxID=2811406 RepID=UPI003BAF39B9